MYIANHDISYYDNMYYSRKAKYLQGPKYLFDFYSLTKNKLDNSALPLISSIRDKLLYDVTYCIYRELRHYPHGSESAFYFCEYEYSWGAAWRTVWEKYKIPKYTCKWIEKSIAEHEQFCHKEFIRYLEECCGSFLYKTINLFNDEKWTFGYGGEKWANISNAAYQLEMDDLRDIRKTVNLIDNLVHQNHNNGNCLNKLYPNIDYFLNAKRRKKDSLWLDNNSSKHVKIFKNRKRLRLI